MVSQEGHPAFEAMNATGKRPQFLNAARKKAIRLMQDALDAGYPKEKLDERIVFLRQGDDG